MSMNKYIVGAAALAASQKPRRSVVGYDWKAIFYDPAGELYRSLQSTPTFDTGYKYQPFKLKTSPFATAATQQLAAGQQLQTALRQQQAANIARLQQQLASMPAAAPIAPSASTYTAPTYAPPSPMPSTPADTPLPADGDGSDGGGAPDAVVGAAAADQYPSLVIRIKNFGDVIKSQGGALGNIAYTLTPATISNVALGKMRDEFKSSLAEKGVDADVAIASAPTVKTKTSELVIGMGLGAGLVGLGALIWRLLKR